MKKTRILSLLALLLCVAMLFAACGREAKSLSIKKIFDDLKADSTARVQSAAKLSVEGGLIDDEGDLALFSQNTVAGFAAQTVFNVATNSVIVTYTDTDTTEYDITLYSDNALGYDVSYFTVVTAAESAGKVTYTSALFAADGTKAAEVERQVAAAPISLDLIRFGDKCYRVAETGAITEAFDWNEFAGNLPNLFAAAKKYYYARVAAPDTGFIVLDQSLAPVSSFVFPSYATNPVYGVLNNGNVFVQYQEKLPDDANKYDLIIETAAGAVEKYNFVQQVFNAKKGTLKEVKSNYVINAITAARDVLPKSDLFESIDKSVDTVARGYKIENKRVSENAQDLLILSLNNKGTVSAVLNRSVDGQSGDFDIVANGILRISDTLGRQYIYDAKGKLIGEVTGALDMNESYIVGQNQIYDLALNPVFNYATEGYDFYDTTKGGVILTKDNADDVAEYYLYANGALTKISEGNTKIFTYMNDRIYRVRDTASGIYTYYNDIGAQLLQTKNLIAIMTSLQKDAFLVRCYNADTNQNEYFRFA